MYLVINKWVTAVKVSNFSGHYLRNRSTLDIGVWVISVYFNIRNTLPKSGTFLLGHLVYSNIHTAYDSAMTQDFSPANGSLYEYIHSGQQDVATDRSLLNLSGFIGLTEH